MTGLSRSGRAASPSESERSRGAPLARAGRVIHVAPLALAGLALVAAGCLFIGEINRAPTAALALVAGGTGPDGDGVILVARKCNPVTLDAGGSSDPDPGETQALTFEWKVDGQPAELHSDLGFQLLGDGKAVLSATRARDYVVDVTAIDPHGARSQPARLTLRILDAPPVPSVTVNSQPSACGDYPAGGQIQLYVNAVDPDDGAMPADGPITCPRETRTYAWTLSPPRESTRAAILDGPCPGAMLPGMLSLAQTDKELAGATVCVVPDVAGAYGVEVVADDGAMRPAAMVLSDGQTAPPLHFQVAPDRPPCMDGFSPAPNLLYILDRAQPAQFVVTEVLDDADPYPNPLGPSTATFRWSLWRASDPTWRALPPSGEASLTIDPSAYAVDELVQVRVQADDRVMHDLAGRCDPAQLACDYSTAYPGVPSCFPNHVCEAFVTWQARFR
jgi:hypothetical protein